MIAVAEALATCPRASGAEHGPLVSIVVNNHNYGRFLRSAIDSALEQTYPHVEVIVVDDGSADDSRQIIADYGRRVVAVLKENGGQGSAFNAGFARCRGGAVIFLDADDVLLPQTAARVANVFRNCPEVAKVLYRMEVIEADGTPTGQLIPPAHLPLPSGDLRWQALRFPDDIAYPGDSGHAFAARVLQRIFPVPEQEYGRVGADLYLYQLSSLFAPVVALDFVGACYRTHGANHYFAPTLRLEQIRQIIGRSRQTHVYLRQLAGALGLAGLPDDPDQVRSVTLLAHRMTSLKLDPERHPVKGDTVLSLLFQGVAACLGRFDLTWPARCVRALWFLALAPAPQPIARWLAVRFFYPETRGAWRRVAAPRLGGQAA